MRKNNHLRLSLSYRRCRKLTQDIVNLGYNRITIRDLDYLIKRNVGGDPRTVRKYKRLLVEYGFLRFHKNLFIVMPLVSRQKTLNQYSQTP